MSDFPTALAVAIRHETRPGSTDGSYTDRPTDRGGPTKWGITQRTLADWRGHPVTAGDVFNLGYDEAAEIYRVRYWLLFHCDQIADQTVATKVFDIAVNCTPDATGRIVQTAANRCQAGDLAVDGVIGPLTIAAVNRCDPMELVTELCHTQSEHYLGLVAADPSERPNLSGWMARARWPWTGRAPAEATT